jgi:hypothetical protein
VKKKQSQKEAQGGQEEEEEGEEEERGEWHQEELLLPEEIIGEGKGSGQWKGKKVLQIRWSDQSISWEVIDTFMSSNGKDVDPAYDALFKDWSGEKIRKDGKKRKKKRKRRKCK